MMARLEDITLGTSVRGITPDGLVGIDAVKWIGELAIQITYTTSEGQLGTELLYRDREPSLDVVTIGTPWSFDGDAGLFRLLSEAQRIRLAHLFDPLLAVHSSLVDPLPHQITAVYGEMLPRQPLRFLLADDPGAGKTIMTGLFIKELVARGDLQRCLVVCPGNLVEQWQDELYRRFQLPFEIMTNEGFEAARTGNWFRENHLVICRLDKLSRNEDVQDKLKQTDWDLIVCDEAHKMSASYNGNEIKYTKRYRLGLLLGTLSRHLLLLTATPHNGKESDFQLFMALLDGDRFEGKFRDGVHVVDTSDLMRRLVKEKILKFDGTPLFPERIANTVQYELSDLEAALYKQVTDYVREQFNLADRLEDGGRRGTVGFALTILQRRLASSPEAIYQSLRRRKKRLESRLREERLLKRAAELGITVDPSLPRITEDILEDLDDAPDAELEEVEERVVDLASAARSIQELQAEIAILQELENAAASVRKAGIDRKWEELSNLLQNQSEMFDAEGHRRKLVIFTEHRDTLSYLTERIRALLGRHEAVVTISGGMGREDRRKAQNAFTQDKEVEILVATDAAGEGINLQRAHLMVNYDLPWNPNRLEQRFGRIHRIGQTEVCHLWNLLAKDTRECDVYERLLSKLEEEREALGGQVFDVLGQLRFDGRPLRDLLLEAIRYGDSTEVKARLYKVVDDALDRDHLKDLVERRALSHDSMDITRVMEIKQQMERADARRLQPHYIAAFFIEAFSLLGGNIHERDPKRYEIKNVPASIRNRDRQIGHGEPVMRRYERVTFHKDSISVPGKPLATFLCPGHPLLDSVIDLIIERHRDLLKRGAVLIDEMDPSDTPRALVYLEHSIQDARTDRSGMRRVVSKRLQFVEIDADGNTITAGQAPYLDYRPATDEEKDAIDTMEAPEWLRESIESRVIKHAINHLVPSHLEEIRERKESLIDKTIAAVRDRLTKEINYWDHRATQLKEQELAGRVNARLNSGRARQRADDLAGRLERRLADLEAERKLSPLPPFIRGGAMIIPAGLLLKLTGQSLASVPSFAVDTKHSELLAMTAVMAAESQLGFLPRDVSEQKLGYDIESTIPGEGRLRFIEVKGRVKGAVTVTVTKNEILTALNKPEDFILAICEIDGEQTTLCYVREPFHREPDFSVTSVNYNLRDMIDRGESPR